MVVGELAQDRHLVVIGGGPGGYHTAIRAAQLGLEVTLIERKQLGGVCLNQGCIPSKVHTQAAEVWQKTKKGNVFGIPEQNNQFDWEQLHEHQAKVVKQLRQGVEQLCEAHKIELVKGEASFLSDDRIGVENGHQFDVYRFKHAVVATGHKPVSFQQKNERLLSAHSLFQQKDQPDTLVVIGTDLYALEAAFSYQTLGTSVTLLMNDVLELEPDIEKELWRSAKKAGITVKKNVEVQGMESGNEAVSVLYEKGGKTDSIVASHVYASSEWRGNTEDIGLERIGVKLNESGYIAVSKTLQTNIPSIYAIGDVTGMSQLATAAIRQGKVLAELLAGKKSEWDGTFIPSVYRTQPPMATVGWTSIQAKNAGRDVVVSTSPFRSNGYATVSGSSDGICVLVKDEATDEVLGVHMIGEGAAELIFAGTLGLEMGARDEDLIFPMYPHPGFSEVMMEAAEGWHGLAIHQPLAKKAAAKQANTN
ncbi:FAD-dependent oxidoreductase [Bacillus sp. JCM 19041]|uniref:dihydrolipoyl dehydrogenase family protein n=1 Tax=Bacillus sp. JCM 19041 TaxID=1460637 RepID=UPI0006D0B946